MCACYNLSTACLRAVLAKRKPKLADLETELRHVHGWVQLGLCLDLSKQSLEEIHATHSSGSDALGMCKAKMLSTWLERCRNATWSTLIAALIWDIRPQESGTQQSRSQ